MKTANRLSFVAVMEIVLLVVVTLVAPTVRCLMVLTGTITVMALVAMLTITIWGSLRKHKDFWWEFR